MLCLKQFLFSDLVLSAVPMAIEQGWSFAVKIYRQKQVAGHRRARSIIKLKFLENVITAFLSGKSLDLRLLRSRRQLAQQLPGLRAELLAARFPIL